MAPIWYLKSPEKIERTEPSQADGEEVLWRQIHHHSLAAGLCRWERNFQFQALECPLSRDRWAADSRLRKAPCNTQTIQGHGSHSSQYRMVGNVSCHLDGDVLGQLTHASQGKKSSLEKQPGWPSPSPLSLPGAVFSKLGVHRGSTVLAQLCIHLAPSSARPLWAVHLLSDLSHLLQSLSNKDECFRPLSTDSSLVSQLIRNAGGDKGGTYQTTWNPTTSLLSLPPLPSKPNPCRRYFLTFFSKLPRY